MVLPSALTAVCGKGRSNIYSYLSVVYMQFSYNFNQLRYPLAHLLSCETADQEELLQR